MRGAERRGPRLREEVLRPLGLLASALLAGAAGLGLEVLLVSLAGLALGYGRAGAFGIALFIAGWALGARAAGTWRGSAPGLLLAAGLAVAAGGAGLVPAVLAASAARPGGWLAGGLVALSVAVVAVPQGAFLPTLARGWRPGGRAGVALLFAAGFAGSAGGAWLLGHALPGARGRPAAALAAGALALLAAAIGAAALFRAPGVAARRMGGPHAGDGREGEVAVDAEGEPGQRASRRARAGPPPRLSPRAAGLSLAVLIGWVVAVEWIGLRIGVLWLGGMQPALTAILVASLAALSAGALVLPALLARSPARVPALLALCALAWPAMMLASQLVPPGLARARPLLAALALVGPALLAFGAAVPLLHREVVGPRVPALGRLLGWEALGALAGVPLTHFVLVPRLGADGALGVWTLLGAAVALALARPLGRGALAAAGVALVAAAAALAVPGLYGLSLPRASPPISNPALAVLDLREDEDFTVAVVHDGLLGERTLLTDGFRAAATGDDYMYMRALGHLPLLLHPEPARVAVLAFGTGTTAGAVSLHPEARRIDVLELSRAVAELAHWFEEANHGVLADLDAALAGEGRVRLLLGDGRRSLAERPGAYDVVTMEPLLPDSPFAVYLYTREFYAIARRALAPGGLLCQWVPPQALEPATFDATVAAFTAALPWSTVWVFGTQVLLLGSEEPPRLDPGRFPAGGPLHAALAALGLEDAAGLLARHVTAGGAWPAVARPLTDRDPWIVYRPARGPERLFDLPANLARLRGLERDPVPGWLAAAGSGASSRLAAARWLRRAREDFAVERAISFGLLVPGSLLAERARIGAPEGVPELDAAPGAELDADAALARARALLGARAEHDPDVGAFERELRAARGLAAGLSLLQLDPTPAGAAEALRALLDAVERYPERAGGHLYAAVALERMGEPAAAEKALARALELCPRVMETPPGRSASNLGFPATERLRAALASTRQEALGGP